MYLFLKNKFFLFFVLLLTVSCNYRRDPSLPYNNKFLKKYGKQIERAKVRHKNVVKQNNIFYDENLNRIANLKNSEDSNKKREDLNKKFLDNYVNNYETIIRKDVSYLDNNYGAFVQDKNKEQKQDKFAYFDKEYLKNKSYNSIDYATLQVNYDYVLLIKELQYDSYAEHFMEKEKEKETIEELKETEVKREKEKTSSNIISRFRDLLRRKK